MAKRQVNIGVDAEVYAHFEDVAGPSGFPGAVVRQVMEALARIDRRVTEALLDGRIEAALAGPVPVADSEEPSPRSEAEPWTSPKGEVERLSSTDPGGAVDMWDCGDGEIAGYTVSFPMTDVQRALLSKGALIAKIEGVFMLGRGGLLGPVPQLGHKAKAQRTGRIVLSWAAERAELSLPGVPRPSVEDTRWLEEQRAKKVTFRAQTDGVLAFAKGLKAGEPA